MNQQNQLFLNNNKIFEVTLTKEQLAIFTEILPSNLKLEFCGKKSSCKGKKTIDYQTNQYQQQNSIPSIETKKLNPCVKLNKKKQKKIKEKQNLQKTKNNNNIIQISLSDIQYYNNIEVLVDEDGNDIFDHQTTKNTLKNSKTKFYKVDQQNQIKNIIKILGQQANSKYFFEPTFEVPEDQQDLDLQIITNRCEFGYYKNEYELKYDLEKMFELFYLNHKRDSAIYNQTIKLQQAFNKLFYNIEGGIYKQKIKRLNKELENNIKREEKNQLKSSSSNNNNNNNKISFSLATTCFEKQSPSSTNNKKRSIQWDQDSVQTFYYDEESNLDELNPKKSSIKSLKCQDYDDTYFASYSPMQSDSFSDFDEEESYNNNNCEQQQQDNNNICQENYQSIQTIQPQQDYQYVKSCMKSTPCKYATYLDDDEDSSISDQEFDDSTYEQNQDEGIVMNDYDQSSYSNNEETQIF